MDDLTAVDGPPDLAARFEVVDHHGHEPDVLVRVTFGRPAGAGLDADETFAARCGPVEGQDDPACHLVRPGGRGPFGPRGLGRRLSRRAALSHPRLELFWRVNDLLLDHREHGVWPCRVCGGDGTPAGERAVLLALPDVLLRRDPAHLLSGVGTDDPDPAAAVFLEATEGCFVRCRLVVELDGGGSIAYSLWVRVTPDTAQRIGRTLGTEAALVLRFEGWLGNALPGAGFLDAPVTVGVSMSMNNQPVVVATADPALTTFLAERHPQQAALAAAFAVMHGGDESA